MVGPVATPRSTGPRYHLPQSLGIAAYSERHLRTTPRLQRARAFAMYSIDPLYSFSSSSYENHALPPIPRSTLFLLTCEPRHRSPVISRLQSFPTARRVVVRAAAVLRGIRFITSGTAYTYPPSINPDEACRNKLFSPCRKRLSRYGNGTGDLPLKVGGRLCVALRTPDQLCSCPGPDKTEARATIRALDN